MIILMIYIKQEIGITFIHISIQACLVYLPIIMAQQSIYSLNVNGLRDLKKHHQTVLHYLSTRHKGIFLLQEMS